MGRRLKDNITSGYIEAANRLNSRKSRRKIVAYVESYDDIFFWRTVLSRFENDSRYFEVMLPSKGTLQRGKKSVLMNLVANGTGNSMIACVDADYDYLLQGATDVSKTIVGNPYVLHTYVYAIENYQCYAPGLHDVCVMATLNDHAIFDFNEYLRLYSETCFPLFVWSIWAYRTGNYPHFSITDFCRVIDPGGFTIDNPQASIDHLRHKVGRRIHTLQNRFPKAKSSYLKVKADLYELGVTPQTTYLYIQGHHLFDTVVAPIMTKVCGRLRQEREREIYTTAAHRTQMRNELSCYENSQEDIRSMLRKSMGFIYSPQFQRLQQDVQRLLDKQETAAEKKEDGTPETS